MGRSLLSDSTTVLFTDIVDSIPLWEKHPVAMKAALARHEALVRQAAELRGGWVFKIVGDSLQIAFPDASDAVAAASEAQRALFAEPWREIEPLRVRMAVHTSCMDTRDDGEPYGAPLNLVARILAAGHGGQILLSASTAAALHPGLPPELSLRDMGLRRLKGFTQPARILQLVVPGLPANFPPLKTLDPRPVHLPAPMNSFVGRAAELEYLARRLENPDVRLLTLIGRGGIGKSRLGMQAATQAVDYFEHGVTCVFLAPLNKTCQAPQALARGLNLQAERTRPLVKTIQAYLHERELLLVLDHFDRVAGAAPLVTEILGDCPRVKVLVTSRRALRVYGECEFDVPPLALPDPARPPTANQLAQYPALQLFVERAQAAQPRFCLNDDNFAAVAQICATLDGVPRAIERAAAHCKDCSPAQILARLGAHSGAPEREARPDKTLVRRPARSGVPVWNAARSSAAAEEWGARWDQLAGAWARG